MFVKTKRNNYLKKDYVKNMGDYYEFNNSQIFSATFNIA